MVGARIVVVAALLAGACTACEKTPSEEAAPKPPAFDRPAWVDSGDPFPPTIAATGLFPKAPDLGVVPEGVIPYEPTHPLYSNGTDKARHIVLPPDSDVKLGGTNWGFPVGTIFVKTFSFADSRLPNGEKLVETRLMRNTDSGWEYALYAWNEDQTEAALQDLERPQVVSHTNAEGETLRHVLPARRDCRLCHSASSRAILGFSELQLNREVDGVNQLQAMHDRGVLQGELPAEPARIEHDDHETEWLLGYAQGNCVHCHHGERCPTAFDMRPEVLVENIVGKPIELHSGAGIRVVPGAPDESMFLRTLTGKDLIAVSLNPMPPVGIITRDKEAIARVESWIRSLE